jgi:hypothetical protein
VLWSRLISFVMFACAARALVVWVRKRVDFMSCSSLDCALQYLFWIFFGAKVVSAPWGMKPNRGDFPDLDG